MMVAMRVSIFPNFSALFLRALGLACLMLGPSLLPAQSDELELRAAYVAGFGSYVEWPAASFADAQSPFVIGVLGDAAVQRRLEEEMRNRRIQGRAVEVRRVEGVAELAGLHLLYMKDGRKPLLRTLAGQPVLTVGNGASFLDAGGIIRFHLLDQHLRFELNGKAAERAGLKLSAKLQQLARVAREDAP